MPEWFLPFNRLRGRTTLIAIGTGLTAVLVIPACSAHLVNSASPRAEIAPGVGTGATETTTAASSEPAQTGTETSTVETTLAATSDPSTPTPTAVTPTTAAATTAAPTTVAPTTAAPTTLAPTTTLAPSPALVWVGAEPQAFVAVGGNSGRETARIQQRLVDLGFWLSDVDGQYGLTTSQAVMAFQKFTGLEASGRVNQATADALTTIGWRAHGLADAGTLVEIDQDKQLIFVVQGGRTVWIFNTSTGDGQPYEEPDQNTPGEIQTGVSITRNGLHSVYRQRPEGWWEGDLGKIYRPKYFSGGQAVHGSNNVPNYPASHGCVRVTTQAMDFIWDSGIMPIDIPVWVHGSA